MAGRSQGDPALRLVFDKPVRNDLTERVSKLSKAKKLS